MGSDPPTLDGGEEIRLTVDELDEHLDTVRDTLAVETGDEFAEAAAHLGAERLHHHILTTLTDE